MLAVIRNNLTGEILAVCEDTKTNRMTNKLYRFVMEMMQINAAMSIDNKDISVEIDKDHTVRFLTYQEGCKIIALQYINGEFFRRMVLAE